MPMYLVINQARAKFSNIRLNFFLVSNPVVNTYIVFLKKLKEEVDRQLDQLLADGKIRESTSPFCHPLLCVLKKNGDVRLCTDLRYVNSGTVGDSFPCPVTEELIMKICN